MRTRRIEFRDEDILRPGCQEIAASKAHGPRQRSCDDAVSTCIDGDPPTARRPCDGLVGCISELMAPEVLPTGVELGEEKVGSARGNERLITKRKTPGEVS